MKTAGRRALAVASAAMLALATPAPAQDNGLGGFLKRMFGGGGAAGAPPAVIDGSQPTHAHAIHRPKKKPRDFVPSSLTRAPGSADQPAAAPDNALNPAAPAAPPAPVAPTFIVDVIGDSLAGQVAQGLTNALTDRPAIATQNKAKESSGLVRDDFYDWGKAAADIAGTGDKIDFVVVMMGSNDSQPLRDGNDVLDPLSDRWKAQYQARAAALLAPFKAKKIPVAWLGLPPMRSDRLSADMNKLNALDRETAEKEGAAYIDIWDAFANPAGGFDAFGPDVTGANAKLRGVDGVHFTKAGADKAASFVAAEIRRAFDRGKPSPDVAALPADIEKSAKDINDQLKQDSAPAAGAAPAVPVAVERPLAGPILSLTARPLSADGTLILKTSGPPTQTAAALKVLQGGVPAAPVPGRADDFAGAPARP